jgi:hypothetical protein
MSSLTRRVGQGTQRRWQSEKFPGVLYHFRDPTMPCFIPYFRRGSYTRLRGKWHPIQCHVVRLLVLENGCLDRAVGHRNGQHRFGNNSNSRRSKDDQTATFNAEQRTSMLPSEPSRSKDDQTATMRGNEDPRCHRNPAGWQHV